MTGISGSERRRRTYILAVRLNDGEKEDLDARIETAGITKAAYARFALFNKPPPRAARRPTADHRAVASLLGHLGKIGSNINQLAKHANAGRYQENSVESALLDLAELRVACLKALGYDP